MQPVSGVGLVGLAVYSHLFLKERLSGLEWGAVALAVAGTVGLGATSSEEGPNSSSGGAAAAADGGAAAAAAAAAAASSVAAAAAGGDGAVAAAAAVDAAAAAATGGGSAPSEPGALRMLGVLLLLAAAVLAVSIVRNRQGHRQRRPGDRPAAAAYGLQAGACFGLSAASCRIGARLPCQGGVISRAAGIEWACWRHRRAVPTARGLPAPPLPQASCWLSASLECGWPSACWAASP